MSYLEQVKRLDDETKRAEKRFEDKKKTLILRYGKIALQRLEALSKIDGVDYIDMTDSEFNNLMADREKPAVEEGDSDDI